MKLQEVGDSYMLTIPRSLCYAKGWSKGTVLKAQISPEGDIVLKEVN